MGLIGGALGTFVMKTLTGTKGKGPEKVAHTYKNSASSRFSSDSPGFAGSRARR